MTVWTVSDTASLMQAFDSAQGGDRIELLPGTYEAAYLDGRSFATPVTITSRDPDKPVVFGGRLLIENVSGVIVEDIDFVASSVASGTGTPQVFVNNSANIVLRDILIDGWMPTLSDGARDPMSSGTTRDDMIHGYAYGTGLRINGSDTVLAEGVEIHSFRTAAYIGANANVTLRAMNIHNVREGINLYDDQNMVIEDSRFYDLDPWFDMLDPAYDTAVHDHADFIQYWGQNSKIGMHGLTIRNNYFEMAEGTGSQTIFGEMWYAPEGVTAKDFVIADNVIVNAHVHGIQVNTVDGVRITNNVLVPNSTDENLKYVPQIGSFGGLSNVLVAGNVLVDQDGILSWGNSTGLELRDNTYLSRDPAADNYWGDWWNSHNYAPITVNGILRPVENYDKAQDEGVATANDTGDGVILTGNAWKSVSLPISVTKTTILTFTFSAETLGEIHGIGFANDGVLSAHHVYQVAGSQGWGRLVNNRSYSPKDGQVTFTIAVGQDFTGTFDELVLISDDDQNKAAISSFSDLSLSTDSFALQVDGGAYAVLSYSPGIQDFGDVLVAPDSVRLVGNAWKAIDMPLSIVSDTVMSFDLSITTAGEIHAIGFLRNGVLVESTTYQLAGSQVWGNQAYAGLYAGGIQSYAIAVGADLYATIDQIVLISDDDAAGAAQMQISNLSFAGVDGLVIGGRAYGVESFQPRYQDFGSDSQAKGGRGVELRGNAWKAVDMDIDITADSVLSFVFNQIQPGEVYGIGFARDGKLLEEALFQIAGSQTFGNQSYNNLYSGGTKQYEIDLGAYLQGSYDQIVFLADDDATARAQVQYLDIVLS